MTVGRRLAALLVASAALVSGAMAQGTLLLEARGGVAAHDVGGGVSLFDPTRVQDINAEMLFTIPNLSAWVPLGELRPHLGATFNIAGHESFGYAGLSWTVRAPVVPVFLEAGLGAAVHNSKARFGCGVLAEAQASLGIDVLPNTALMGTVQHVTDFGFCGTASRPLTTAGLRLGVRF
ncbi:acyloxyacyl hydrolase [Devosia sp. PTR5]|jgi:hypothetical protein|uniref:Acyloxyacyl hydrolase n=1 Tax=Devosia oryzisoli TaxID=2774138 RepID=A0A927FUN0_9HYPH|nr:acyloxyacyl hydrolase [Devosia oryzisoli]MBD8066620.1 acyloxyacyl hydrolase [Devosia oryzisoli]